MSSSDTYNEFVKYFERMNQRYNEYMKDTERINRWGKGERRKIKQTKT
jgi:hypothetical protein